MKKRIKRMIACGLGAVLVGGIMTGCSLKQTTSTDVSSQTSSTGNDIYFIPIVETGAYWSPMIKGAQNKAKELGYNLILRTSAASDSQKNEKHLGFLDEAISKKPAGIAIAPMEPNMFDPKIAEVKKLNIPVVTFDADVKTTDNRDAYIGTDNKLAGEALGANGAKKLKEKGIKSGSIALVATNLTQTTMIARKDGIKASFDAEMGADAANFKWIEPIQDNDQSAESKRLLEGQLVSNPDMVAVFSLGSEGPDVGVMEALKSQGKGGTVMHFGFDYTPTWENGIDSGLITGIVDQDAYSIGSKIIEVLDKKMKGENVDSNYPVEVQWVEAKDIVEYGKTKNTQFAESTINE